MNWGILLTYVFVSEKLNFCKKKGSPFLAPLLSVTQLCVTKSVGAWTGLEEKKLSNRDPFWWAKCSQKWHFSPWLDHEYSARQDERCKLDTSHSNSLPNQGKVHKFPIHWKAVHVNVFKMPRVCLGGGGGAPNVWLPLKPVQSIHRAKQECWLQGMHIFNLWVEPLLPLSLSQLWLCLLFQCKLEAVAPRAVCFLH